MRYNRYRNTKVEVDGIMFHSKKEAQRYQELLLLERGGIISDLKLQPRFLLQDKFKHKDKRYRKIEYSADFQYVEDGDTIVEDVKSFITKKDPVYRLKKKLLLFKYPDINFKET